MKEVIPTETICLRLVSFNARLFFERGVDGGFAYLSSKTFSMFLNVSFRAALVT
jgi:hypothetical protein